MLQSKILILPFKSFATKQMLLYNRVYGGKGEKDVSLYRERKLGRKLGALLTILLIIVIVIL